MKGASNRTSSFSIPLAYSDCPCRPDPQAPVEGSPSISPLLFPIPRLTVPPACHCTAQPVRVGRDDCRRLGHHAHVAGHAGDRVRPVAVLLLVRRARLTPNASPHGCAAPTPRTRPRSRSSSRTSPRPTSSSARSSRVRPLSPPPLSLPLSDRRLPPSLLSRARHRPRRAQARAVLGPVCARQAAQGVGRPDGLRRRRPRHERAQEVWHDARPEGQDQGLCL